jgi:hypothetical protein
MKLPKDYVPGVGVVKPTGGYGGFGQRMLEKFGWAEGQGLGKEKHGMKAAIEVQKKEDTLGVRPCASGVCFREQHGCLGPYSSPATSVQLLPCCIQILGPNDALCSVPLFPFLIPLCSHTYPPTHLHTHTPLGGRQAVQLAVGLEVLGGRLQQRRQVHQIAQQQPLHLLHQRQRQ